MTISILGADYISFYDYAKIKGLSVGSMINRAKKGKYNTVPSPKKQTKNAGKKPNEKNDKYDTKLLCESAFIPRFA